MLTRDELVGLYRDRRDQKVLSVYVAAGETDPADRRAWATRLEAGLDEERRRIQSSEPTELASFDAARALVEAELLRHRAFLPERGWVGFATADELFYGEGALVPMSDLVRWEEGLRVAPYVRALKQSRVVVTVLADSRRARLFTYLQGEIEEVEGVVADADFGDLADSVSSTRAGATTGSRGATGTDTAHRLLEQSAVRLQAEVVDRVTELAGDDGFLVVGGTPEVVRALARQAASFRGRMLERPAMHLGMTEAEVKEQVEAAASELTRSAQDAILGQIVDAARSGGRGCLGIQATKEALREGRVDALLISRELREREGDLADHFVGTAFEQGAGVEELSGSGGRRLDTEAEGVGARLRYRTAG